ncbi:hypothetical protein ABE164_20835, partial [Bacillus subtilis]
RKRKRGRREREKEGKREEKEEGKKREKRKKKKKKESTVNPFADCCGVTLKSPIYILSLISY